MFFAKFVFAKFDFAVSCTCLCVKKVHARGDCEGASMLRYVAIFANQESSVRTGQRGTSLGQLFPCVRVQSSGREGK